MDENAVEFWESRYAERDRIWSGRPNQALVDTAPRAGEGATALDLGCGEGGDSIWLAEQGWRVTAVDISTTALSRAQQEWERRDGEADRITWVTADLATWQPEQSYGLVSACFLHSPVEFPRTEALRRFAAAVAPSGHLLIVGHAEPPPWSRHHQHDEPHEMLRAAQELDALALGDEWQVVVCEDRERAATGPDGEAATLLDSVLLLRRGAVGSGA